MKYAVKEPKRWYYEKYLVFFQSLYFFGSIFYNKDIVGNYSRNMKNFT